MPDLLSLFKGWPPQAYGIWTIVAILTWHFGKLWLDTRKLSIEDREARRLGFMSMVDNLQDENRNLLDDIAKMRLAFEEERQRHREELAQVRKEHDDYRALCQRETDQMRQHIAKCELDILGLQRQLASHSVSLAQQVRKMMLPGFHDPEEDVSG